MKPAEIVLIEDNPADVLLVEIALREAGIGCSLTRFESGNEAIEALCGLPEQGGIQPNAILLDLNTPGSDGFEALVKLKQFPRLAQVPIAVLTSSRAPSDRNRAAILGVRYIQK